MFDEDQQKNKVEIFGEIKNIRPETELRSGRITIDKETTLRNWCSLLNCEEADLLKAISEIGNSIQAVNDYLILNRQKKS